ncbi:MAG: T9SS type A sorting domain-containing protein [Candidatus Delongbacteria bacterium]|nr:T9SS type A sorting domain-containing protein [Candidatus Delongbacteria bacterium]
MYKRLSLVMLFVFISYSFAFNPRLAKPQKLVKAPRMIEHNSITSSSGKMYYGNNDGMFGKSANGYGWYQGYNRKVQYNLNTFIEEDMYGSVFRKLYLLSGSGTIGGLAGMIEGDPSNPTFSYGNFQVYDSSIYQTVGTDPGGRYPYTCEFINGYVFGMFNDYDTTSDHTISQPMFVIGDFSWGYNFTTWTNPRRVECSQSGTVIPNAWQGTGDVVYDPDSEYYYWTQGWNESLDSLALSVTVGRTQTPFDAGSWEWTDHNLLKYDCISYVDTPTLSAFGNMHFSYAKDIYGNGTGYGIGVVMSAIDGQINPSVSYVYTTDWGADDNSGTWEPNWKDPSMPGMFSAFYTINASDIFDWYGETLTTYDSIGYNYITEEVVYDTTTVTMDDPFISWNISAVTTENNTVHVLLKVFPASSDNNYVIYPWTDNGFRSGYYDLRGQISETGVTWQKAVLIANFVDTHNGWEVEDNGIEWKYDDFNTLSISYAGYGQLFAGWLDKPEFRAIPFETDSLYNFYKYYDDGYATISYDGGDSWGELLVDKVETGIPEDPIWYIKYAANVTNTDDVVDEGWSFSNHGRYSQGVTFTFAGCQYSDPASSGNSYLEKEQFLSTWCVAYKTGSIEAEPVSIAKDFELSQNYPNPFNPVTSINFILKNNADVKLSVYNSKGELVSNLKNEKMTKGSHSVNFDATNLNSGLYFYTLKVNDRSESKKMILVK